MPRLLSLSASLLICFGCSILLLGTPVVAENDRWIPGYSSPGIAFASLAAAPWSSNGFIVSPGITNCLSVPGPNGTFDKAQILVWNGDYYKYTGSGCTVGSISTLAQRGTNIYVGGNFTSIDGQAFQYLARWDGQSWSTPWVDQLTGPVFDLAYDGTQHMYVGGSFGAAGATPLSNIGRLNGFLWEPLFDSGGIVQGTDGTVRQVEVGVGDIVAAGQFTTAGGETLAESIASWSGGQWDDLNGGIVSGPGIQSMSVGSGEVWVSGGFDDGNIPVKAIAYFDLSGETWNSPGDIGNLPGQVFEVDLTGGNRVFARGDFTGFGDPNTRRLAEWNPVIDTWESVPNFEDAYDPTLFLSGIALVATSNDLFFFDQRDDNNEADLPVFHSGITRFDGTNWHGLGQGIGDWDLDGQGHYVTGIYEYGGEIIVGGRFPNAGDALMTSVARWQIDDWVPVGEELASSGAVLVKDFATYQGDLIMGGCFTTSGATTLNSIARWNGSAWVAIGSGFAPNFCLAGIPDDILSEGVHTLLPMGANLYVGGGFTGSPADNLAMWNGATWSEIGGGTNGVVNDLVEMGGDLFAAGTFTRTNSNTFVVKRVAKWNGVTWDDLDGGMDGGTPQYEGVFALATIGSDVYAAGDFTTAGGVAANNIARWDGTDWNPLGDGVNGLVLDLEVVGTDLYVSGEFTQAGGESAMGIAKWDGANWSALGYGINNATLLSTGVGTGFELFFSQKAFRPDESPVGEPSGKLYVGGHFTYTGQEISSNFGIYQVGEIIEVIFEDDFESGNTSNWSAAVP